MRIMMFVINSAAIRSTTFLSATWLPYIMSFSLFFSKLNVKLPLSVPIDVKTAKM